MRQFDETMHILLLILVLPAMVLSIYVPGLPTEHYKNMGDLNIGIITPVHHYEMGEFCSSEVRELSALQRLEALAFFFEEINNSSVILPNNTLGFIMFDDCDREITALAQALHFADTKPLDTCFMLDTSSLYTPDIPSLSVCTNHTVVRYDVLGVIGSERSDTTRQISNVLTSVQMPQISYLATAQALSNKFKYNYFQRTLPPDELQAQAVMSFFKHFNWTYVSVVYSEDFYDDGTYKVFANVAVQNEICFGKILEVRRDFRLIDWSRVIYQLYLDTPARVVLVLTSREEGHQLLAANDRLIMEGRLTWVAGNTWAKSIKEIDSWKGTLGMFSVNVMSQNEPRFDEYFQNLSPNSPNVNPWMHEFWKKYFDCYPSDKAVELGGKECDPSLRFTQLPSYFPEPTTSLVYDSVYAYASAFHSLLEGPCSLINGEERDICLRGHLIEALNNVTFDYDYGDLTFDSNRDVMRPYVIHNVQNFSGPYQFVDVAIWDSNEKRMSFKGHPIQWASGKRPESICSGACGKGHEQVFKESPCCWDCVPCEPNQYTTNHLFNQQRCYTCANNTLWPDEETRTKCVPIDKTHLSWTDPLGIVLCVIASCGIVLCLIVTVIFIINNKHPLIKASSRELSYFLLGGLVCSFILVYCFLMYPTYPLCFVHLLGISICFTLMYAPLLTKTVRIQRIFTSGAEMNRRLSCVNSKSQLLIALNIILVHICIIVAWSMADPPHPKSSIVGPSGERPREELSCYFSSGGFITSVVYNSLLLGACVFFAFKTRKLPHNFNESRYINFCVFSTVLVMITFMPAYFAVTTSIFKVLFLSLAVIANATVILCTLFLSKIYALYFVSARNQHVKLGGTIRLQQLQKEDDENVQGDETHTVTMPDFARRLWGTSQSGSILSRVSTKSLFQIEVQAQPREDTLSPPGVNSSDAIPTVAAGVPSNENLQPKTSSSDIPPVASNDTTKPVAMGWL